MSGPGEHEHIEIELTSHDPAVGDHPHAATPQDAAVAVSANEPVERRNDRLVPLVMAVIGALVVGVVIGSVGRGGADESNGSVPAELAAIDAAPTTLDPAFERLDTLPPVPAPTTTRPSLVIDRPVNSEAPESVGASVEPFEVDVHESLAQLPVEIIASTWQGHSLAVDLSTGRAREVTTGQEAPGVNQVAVGNGWMAFSSYDWMNSLEIIHDDGTVVQVADAYWPIYPNQDGSGLWVGTGSDGPPSADMVEVDALGPRTGRRIDVDGGLPIGPDPRGGLVIRGVGGDYSVDDEGADLLTRGSSLAVGVTRLVAKECDERRQCTVVVIDRVTGERSTIKTGIDITVSPFGFWGPFGAVGMMNADESKLIVVAQGDAAFPDEWVPPVAFVVDLATGDASEIGNMDGSPSIRWSPDGRFVFWVDNGTLSAYEVDAGVSVPVSGILLQVGMFEIRPVLPSVESGGATTTTTTTTP